MRRLLLALVACWAWPLRAQMDMQHSMKMNEGPLGIPESRMGSGTSWLPDASPMHATHMVLGDWTLMLHGKGFAQYDWQGGPRGSNQLGFVNWAMAAASRPLGGGRLELRSMLSAEPWTIGGRGYPLLLQSGESYRGTPLHHWQDGTHITFGVVTAGVFTRSAKLEGSWFNGREPDEDRTGFDYSGRRLDSYSARLTLNPDPRWSVSAWYGYLKSPEVLHPDESLHRYGVAALTTQALGRRGQWATALIWGANDPVGLGGPSSSVVLESTLELDETNALFGRVEYVRKSAQELDIASAPATAQYDVGALALGYLRTVGTVAGLATGLGARGSVNVVPSSLEGEYGGRTPVGLTVYVRLQPATAH